VTVLIVAGLMACSVAQWIFETMQPDVTIEKTWVRDALALGAGTLGEGSWWQFLTYGLVHAHPAIRLAELFLFYFAGSEVEPIFGGRKTLGLFLLAQVVGGLVQLLGMPGMPGVHVTGVSAAATAFVAAYATTLPELEVSGNLFFIVPVSIRAKYLGLAFAFISAMCWSARVLPLAAPAAAFAGCVIGWFYARQLGFGRPYWFQRIMFDRRQREARLARMPAEQFLAEEIDPILEKIARTGMGSLTREERKLLERGREKMSTKRG
jgi:membrane associated rhomboid family serine protease